MTTQRIRKPPRANTSSKSPRSNTSSKSRAGPVEGWPLEEGPVEDGRCESQQIGLRSPTLPVQGCPGAEALEVLGSGIFHLANRSRRLASIAWAVGGFTLNSAGKVPERDGESYPDPRWKESHDAVPMPLPAPSGARYWQLREEISRDLASPHHPARPRLISTQISTKYRLRTQKLIDLSPRE